VSFGEKSSEGKRNARAHPQLISRASGVILRLLRKWSQEKHSERHGEQSMSLVRDFLAEKVKGTLGAEWQVGDGQKGQVSKGMSSEQDGAAEGKRPSQGPL